MPMTMASMGIAGIKWFGKFGDADRFQLGDADGNEIAINILMCVYYSSNRVSAEGGFLISFRIIKSEVRHENT